jgi:hypothetical protein
MGYLAGAAYQNWSPVIYQLKTAIPTTMVPCYSIP